MKFFDRVKETSTTTGTGDFTLAGAVSGFRAFADVLSTSDTCYYSIALQGGSEWEVGLGTYSASNTLTRTTVHASSNSGSAVDFSTGTKDVMLTVPAQRFEDLVSEQVVSGSAVNIITFSGLDGDADKGYRLEFEVISSGTSKGIDLLINNDTTRSNYTRQEIRVINATGSYSNSNDPYIGITGASSGDVTIGKYLISDLGVTIGQYGMLSATSTNNRSGVITQKLTSLPSNITRLDLKTDDGSSTIFGVGSRFKLYRRRDY